jgi:predicted permease
MSLIPLLRILRDRLRAVLRPDRVRREIEDEVRFHYEMRVKEHMADGKPPTEARAAAAHSFGRVAAINDLAYDVRGGGRVEALVQDVRYALRGLAAKPAFTAGVVLTLALGIGANTAMFGIVDRMLFRPPPYLIDPATAHRIYTQQMRRGVVQTGNVSQFARYVDFTNFTHAFSETAAFSQQQLAVGVGDAAHESLVGVVSATFFHFFDAPPAIGRYFTAQEDAPPQGAPVAVASYATWQTEYGGRMSILGSRVQIGSATYTIIGVTPRGFAGVWPDYVTTYYLPVTTYAAAQAAGFAWLRGKPWWTTYSWGWLSMLARRKPGVSVEAANADLTNAMNRSLDAELGERSRTNTSRGKPARAFVGPVLASRGPNAEPVARISLWLAGVAVIVLLIACANVANLLLARALRRRREIAVRLALGAGMRRLAAQLLTESLVLAIAGGTFGLLVAHYGGNILRATMLSDTAPADLFADPRVVLATAGVTSAIGIITGLAPILQARRADLTQDLKTGVREGNGARSAGRIGLIIVQAALSALLLVGAGVFVRSLRNVRGVRLGYDTTPVLLVNLNFRGARLTAAQMKDLRERLLETARAIPGVTHVSERTAIPFIATKGTLLYVAGIDTVAKLGQFDYDAVSPDYFATIGTRIIRGRAFAPQDSPRAPLVMIVSEAMAQRLWPGRNAIGQCIRVGADTMPCTTVVGVAENIRNQSMRDDPAYYYYMPIAQVGAGGFGLFVRGNGDAATFAEAVRRRLQREMPGTAYVTTTRFADVIGTQTMSWTMGATMFTAFGLLALVVAAVGLYSVIAYSVEQRTHELGVRLALGARARDLIAMVIRDAAALTTFGAAVGMGIALYASHWIQPLLYEESSRDPVVFAAVVGVLLLVAVAASAVPARRAARIDAQAALRSE